MISEADVRFGERYAHRALCGWEAERMDMTEEPESGGRLICSIGLVSIWAEPPSRRASWMKTIASFANTPGRRRTGFYAWWQTLQQRRGRLRSRPAAACGIFPASGSARRAVSARERGGWCFPATPTGVTCRCAKNWKSVCQRPFISAMTPIAPLRARQLPARRRAAAMSSC